MKARSARATDMVAPGAKSIAYTAVSSSPASAVATEADCTGDSGRAMPVAHSPSSAGSSARTCSMTGAAGRGGGTMMTVGGTSETVGRRRGRRRRRPSAGRRRRRWRWRRRRGRWRRGAARRRGAGAATGGATGAATVPAPRPRRPAARRARRPARPTLAARRRAVFGSAARLADPPAQSQADQHQDGGDDPCSGCRHDA